MSTRTGFLRSRWVQAPRGVEELDPAQLAPGFRAAGVACGLKPDGGTDVGLLVCDAERVASAIALTANAAAAAPVRVCREQVDGSAIRAVAVNSGNANAATGEQGYRDALAMRDTGAEALGVEPAAVAVGETGVIGVPLDVASVLDGIRAAAAELSETGRCVRRRDHDHRSRPQAVRPAGGPGQRLGPGKGRGDDRAGLRDDALLRPNRRGGQ